MAAVESRFGCFSPAANQEDFFSLCMLGKGIYETDAIGLGLPSSAAPRVTASRRPGKMAFRAGLHVPHGIPGSETTLIRNI